jgi:hypothetical protein
MSPTISPHYGHIGRTDGMGWEVSISQNDLIAMPHLSEDLEEGG